MTNTHLTHSLLASPEDLPLRQAESVQQLGPTVVLAPHPDDESLGCGGLIAQLRRHGLPVYVVVISDGSRSHPNSQAYPSERLAALRQTEATAAVARLGMAAQDIYFLALPDGSVPHSESNGFAAASAALQCLLDELQPHTVLSPWRRDPHGDHIATWQMAHRVVASAFPQARLIEYPIWSWEAKNPHSPPHSDDAVVAWRLDIEAVLPAKQAAIREHVSQTTRLIEDAPEGFILTAQVLAHFAHPWELFIEDA